MLRALMASSPERVRREPRELRRLMEAFMARPSAATQAKIERLLEGQRERFRQLEQERMWERMQC